MPVNSLDEVLRALAAREEFGRLRRYRALPLWPQVVGKELARRSVPIGVSGGTLVVACAEPAWANELVFLKDRILTILRRDLGVEEITDLRVEVRALPPDLGRVPDGTRPAFPRPGTPPDFSAIPDEELRRAVEHLWRRAEEGSDRCSSTSGATSPSA